jgi:hypothetical protein
MPARKVTEQLPPRLSYNSFRLVFYCVHAGSATEGLVREPYRGPHSLSEGEAAPAELDCRGGVTKPTASRSRGAGIEKGASTVTCAIQHGRFSGCVFFLVGF